LSIFLRHGGKDIQLVLNLEHFLITCVKFSSEFKAFFSLIISPALLENLWILVSELKNGLVVRNEDLGSVGVCCGPFIKIECIVENTRIKQTSHVDSFIDEVNEVMLEQMGINICVLEFADVIYHEVH